ncbi:crossover junction endodeoxyribonuclease RuvC [Listeria newyorkensis]|uniref:Crossover junction endodeoxyribonuclease RuvC n=1 Tax=Listeria newyorkensis TaxID=1497681 RepID=A0A841YU20_9LIST|nr:crossover junction endodeoxyribonuclease RuvC [Listeria newyorkensis]MBC1456263.1 crossover junction endodeoxyribonuclease RuvC [Listeria newyorkensis]
MTNVKPIRILAFDTSLGRPGIALVEVRNGKASIIDMSNVQTTSKQSLVERKAVVYAWAVFFIHKHRAKGFDYIVRELFQGRTYMQNYPVFSAWGATEDALNVFRLDFTDAPITPATIKKHVVGNGKADKQEVADAVRRWTGYEGAFASDDESDAVAIALYKAITEGLIE